MKKRGEKEREWRESKKKRVERDKESRESGERREK
jgi:hypothetical protein